MGVFAAYDKNLMKQATPIWLPDQFWLGQILIDTDLLAKHV